MSVRRCLPLGIKEIWVDRAPKASPLIRDCINLWKCVCECLCVCVCGCMWRVYVIKGSCKNVFPNRNLTTKWNGKPCWYYGTSSSRTVFERTEQTLYPRATAPHRGRGIYTVSGGHARPKRRRRRLQVSNSVPYTKSWPPPSGGWHKHAYVHTKV